jgi:hypothetical protein
MIRRRPHDDEEESQGGVDDEERVSFLGGKSRPTTTSTFKISSTSTNTTCTAANSNSNNDTSFSSSSTASDDLSSSTAMIDYGDVLNADEEERKASHGHRLCWSFRVFVSLSMLCVVTIAGFLLMLPPSSSSSSYNKEKLHNDINNNNSDGRVKYECPTTVSEAVNDAEESFEEEYTSVTRQITNNITEFKERFRTEEFDGWGRSYEEVKRKSYPFKSKYFPRHLENGSSIYESACGIGLNLLMTLEILEEYGITDLVVYGNEYVPESADKANWILSDIGTPGNAQLGKICPGDSSNLSFVPSNSMDLVYTGYITPVMDPLHLGTNNHDYKEYTSLCQMVKFKGTQEEGLMTGGYDWMGIKLNDIVQLEQERWYGNWVAEMTRIAKPGSPILIEQVSPSYCTKRSDWGGVDREYWNRTATENTYGWNVDPSSIEIVDDLIFKQRYHVSMMTIRN